MAFKCTCVRCGETEEDHGGVQPQGLMVIGGDQMGVGCEFYPVSLAEEYEAAVVATGGTPFVDNEDLSTRLSQVVEPKILSRLLSRLQSYHLNRRRDD